MASTMLTGDKRWASTRKSGMTVLGKVPKPINLPSQRLENHGLDPNVEIVPKGTLTWGSRPGSTVPNVWTASSLLSPNTDGSPGSPSHLEGRPSSGSGTRPSTAGSDKSHEPLSNAWGPNLRPSSASGSLVSNQSSIVANRPRSADARPSSSQLSRFAETPVESTVAWGPTRTIERAGPASSKNNPITLTPENFPSLGSEKTSDSRGHSSHGRPGSSSGTTAMHKEAVRPLSSGNSNEDTHSDHGTVNSWKKDDYNNVVGGPPNMNWHRDSQQAHPYTSGNISPQHLGPWPSAPIQSPDGGWHRGGGVGGPYRPSVLPGGYPMEPYACYPQYSPASGLFRPSSEPVPKPGAGPGGFYHSKNGESYHHHQMADSYIVPNHPVIPVRPGMYPHAVPYEGYYGPSSAGFHNSSEFGMPVRGIPNQVGTYDRANLPDPEKLHVVPDVHASPTTKEQKESTHPHVTLPGQYKVLLKQHDNREDKSDTKVRGEQSVLGSQPQLDRVLPVTSYGDSRRRNHGKDDRMVYVNLRPGQEASSQRDQWDSPSRDSVVPNLLVNISTETDGSHIINPENTAFPVTKKNASLIEKLEGLNNKARSAVGQNKGDEAKHPTTSTKTDQSTSLISTSVASTGLPSSSASHEMVPCAGNANKISLSDSSKSSDLTALALEKPGSSDSGEKAQPQVHRRAHVVRGRTDHPKLRPDSRGAEWVSKSAGSDMLVMENMTDGQNAPGLQVPDSHVLHETADVVDHKAQRTKLKEIAIRRAKELQEQEEERTREQKAKALAKLEELNRRTAAQASNQKINDLPPITEVPAKQEEGERAAREQKDNILIKPDDSNMMTAAPSPSQNTLQSNAPQQKQDPEAGSAVKTDSIVVEAPVPLLAESLTLSVEINDIRAEDSVGLPSHVLISDSRGPAIPSSDHHEGNVSRRKATGSRKRSNIPKGENLSEKPTTAESTTSSGEVAILTSHGDSLPLENTTHHKKRSNKNARNKSKMDEVIMSSALPTKEGLDKLPTESSETQTQSIKAVMNQAITSDQGQTQATDKLSARMDSQWKPQSTKKPVKSQHVRTVDKSEGVMWAPVRISNAIEPSGENGKRGFLENKITNRKNEHDEQIGTRTKRAEMERYVPKAVAKELLQQCPREPLLPRDQATGKLPYDQATGKPDSGSGNILENPEMDTKDREVNKLNKRGKVRPSWRQRNSAEALSQNYVEPSDQNKTTKPESQILQDDWNSNQGNLVPTEKIAVPTRNIERRQQFVVQEHKDQWSKSDTKIFTQHPVSNLNEKDRKNASRVKGSEQVRTQWQPKSHGDGGQRISFEEVAQNENKDAPVPRANDSFHHEANRGVQVLMDQPPRQQGHYNDRFSRGQETTYRGRANSHLEYHPIGSHNRQGPMVEEAHSGTHGSRYRERGQPYSRRGGGGNFYGQRGAAVVQTGDSCNSADWN